MQNPTPPHLLKDPVYATEMLRDSIRRNDLQQALACFEFASSISPEHARLLLRAQPSARAARRLARVLMDAGEPTRWACFGDPVPLCASSRSDSFEAETIDHLSLPTDDLRNPTLLMLGVEIPLCWNQTIPILLACDIAQRGLDVFQKLIPAEPRLQHKLDVSRRLAIGQATHAEYAQAAAEAEPFLRAYFNKLRDVIENPNRFSFAFSAISMTGDRPLDLNRVSEMVGFSFAGSFVYNDVYFAERAHHALRLVQYYLGEAPSPPSSTTAE